MTDKNYNAISFRKNSNPVWLRCLVFLFFPFFAVFMVGFILLVCVIAWPLILTGHVDIFDNEED